MKYRKLLMFTICAIAIIGAGCAKSENEDNEERAIQLLQEKYGEQFRVIRVDDSKTDGTYDDYIMCPKDNPDIVFAASINTDDDSFSDDYVNKNVCWKISQSVDENINNIENIKNVKLFGGVESTKVIPGDAQVYTHSIGSKPEIDDPEVDIHEYAESISNFKVRTEIFLVPKYGMRLADLYWHLSNAYRDIKDIKGDVMLHIVNKKQMGDVRSFLKENSELDYSFVKMAAKFDSLFIEYEDGVPKMSETEFVNAYKKMMNIIKKDE